MKLVNYCPWKSHIYQLETELGLEGKVKFVLYEDEREKKWRVQVRNIDLV